MPFFVLCRDGVEVDLGLPLRRLECGSEVDVAMLMDEHDLQPAAGISLSNELQGWRTGRMFFAFVSEIPAIVIQEAFFDLLCLDSVPCFELFLDSGGDYRTHRLKSVGSVSITNDRIYICVREQGASLAYFPAGAQPRRRLPIPLLHGRCA